MRTVICKSCKSIFVSTAVAGVVTVDTAVIVIVIQNRTRRDSLLALEFIELGHVCKKALIFIRHGHWCWDCRQRCIIAISNRKKTIIITITITNSDSNY